MPEGTLVYEPKILASGKTRKTIIRKHARAILPCLQPYAELLSEKSQGMLLAEQLPTETDLNELMTIAFRLSRKNEDSGLTFALNALEQDLIIPSRKSSVNWAILKVDPALVSSELENLKSAGINISGSTWGPHISVIRGEQVDSTLWSSRPRENEIFSFEKLRFKAHNGYYWYDIRSSEIEDFRVSLGLAPKCHIPFHITIGKRQ